MNAALRLLTTPTRAWSWWVGLLGRREPGDTIACFRILSGLALIATLVDMIAGDMVTMLWLDAEFGGYRSLKGNWLIQALGGPTPGVVWPLFVVTLGAGVALTLGVWGRAMSLIGAQGLLALATLNDHSRGSYDILLVNSLWLLVFADSTATLSLRSRLRTGRWRSDDTVPSWPRYLMILQAIVLYTGTGIHKISVYWTPAGGFSALYYIMQQPSWHRGDMSWLAWIYPVTQIGTAVTWVWELTWPVILLVFYFRETNARVQRPGPVRRLFRRYDPRVIYAGIGCVMHLTVWVFMDVGPFHMITLAYYPALFAPRELRSFGARLMALRRRGTVAGAAASVAILLLSLLVATPARAGGPDDDDDEPRRMKVMAPPAAPAAAAEAVYDFADVDVSGELVSTANLQVGGARDVDPVRAALDAGRVPLPDRIRPAGLFSEYDLPLRSSAPCAQTLCLRTETVEATLIAEPDVHYLTQIGFASATDPTQLPRPALNIVLVVDQSSSMAGAKMATAQAAASAVADQLTAGDQLSIVGFGSSPQILLQPVAMPGSGQVSAVIYGAMGQTQGATALERGLFTGFEVARRSGRAFPGATRVILITDDRPTVGRGTSGPFMSLALQAAARGIGLTTIGVGVNFGAGLAYKLGSVRGGNVVALRDPTHARERISGEFGSLVHEFAHELVIEVEPAPGMRVASVYGIPGELFERRGDGIAILVETLFVSTRRGAIYVSLAPRGRANLPRAPVRVGAHLGHVRMRYRELDGGLRSDDGGLRNIAPLRASPGLTRGALLVELVTAMKRIAELTHGGGDSRAAGEIARALVTRFTTDPVKDPALEDARELVAALAQIVGSAN